MIHLVPVLTGVDLTLPGSGLSFELANPAFETDAIPGTVSLPFDLPWTRENLRGLNFPHLYRGPGGPPPVEVDCYLDGVRWRRGRLVFREVDVQGQILRYNFVADAADLATQIKDVRLPTLPLGQVLLLRQPSTADYALLPVRNTIFFGEEADKRPADYHGVLNYHVGGQYPLSAFLAPQPYLVPVLRKVMAHFGYEVVGPWVEDAEIQKLVFYSDRVLATGATQVELSQHVPDVTVADLLLSLQEMFCLLLHFDSTHRQLRITPLRDVVAAGSGPQRPRDGIRRSTVANDTNGFELRLAPGGDDELDKTLDTSWQVLRVGAGGEKLEAKAGTLHLVREPDDQRLDRGLLLPAIEAKGASPDPAVSSGNESKVGLRLLFDRGLHPDSQGNDYPLGSALNRTYANGLVGNYTLHWEGPAGLYAQWHQAWLTFRARAVQHTYESEFRIADLLTLDPGQPELVDSHLQLWQKVSVQVTANQPLTRATITYQEIL